MARFPPGTKLAQYTVLGKLARGGMAEVYLARRSGHSGFAKTLVLKVMHSHLTDDPDAKRMFHNEAKLAALLNHPNIVQVFDFGVEEEVHYIAMEYIDGKNLNGILRGMPKGDRRLPRAMALRIAADACAGLDYAHNLTGTDGAPLDLIHRDISLENIVVTYSGQVKVVDFGLAKSSAVESYTSQGTLKGKYRYMAPEMIRGESLDHRIDVFAVGVVLYSLLLGRMPFTGSNHAQLLEQIVRHPPTRPQALVPDLPDAVEQVLLNALEKDQEARFQSAGELQAELERLLRRAGTPVTTFHLAQFMEALFPPGTDEMRQTYLQLKDTLPDSTPASAAVKAPSALEDTVPNRPASGSAARPTLQATVADRPQRRRSAPPQNVTRATVPDRPLLLAEETEQATKPDRPVPVPRAEEPKAAPGRRRLVLTAIVVGSLLLLGGAAAGTYALLSAVGEPDGQTPPASDAGPRPPADTAVVVTPPADAARPDQGASVDLSGPRPDEETPARASPKRGYLTITAPTPGEVLARGRRLGALPLHRRALRPGRYSLTIRSRSLGYQMVKQVRIRAGHHSRLAPSPRKGTIRLLARPWARVYLDGKYLGTTPIKPITVYEGPHQLRLKNPELKVTRRIPLKVRPGQVIPIKVRLDE